jgi:hypothetical protein
MGVRRWLWNIFCALSLLIFILSVMIWVRSWFVGEAVARYRVWPDQVHQPATFRGSTYAIAWGSGAILIGRVQYQLRGVASLPSSPEYRYEKKPPHSLVAASSKGDGFNLQLGQFQLRYAVNTDPAGWTSHQSLTLPLWLFLPAAIPPLIWWRRWQRRHLHLRGFPVAVGGEPPEIASCPCRHGDSST